MSEISHINALTRPFLPLEIRIWKNAEISFQVDYLYEECFSTIPKTVSYFAAEKITKTFEIKILQNPFLAHLYILIRTYPQNFMPLTLIVSAGR